VRIAIYHALYSGGALRTLADQAERLARSHTLHLFTLASAEQSFGGLAALVARSTVVEYQPLRLRTRPFGRVNQLIRIRELGRMERAEREAAHLIDSGAHDVVLVHPNVHTNSPAVLRHVGTPTVFCAHETLRLVYDQAPATADTRTPAQRALDRLDPLPRAYVKAVARADRRNLQAANRVVVNSRFTRDAFVRAYGLEPAVCYHGVDTTTFSPGPHNRQGYVLSVGAFGPRKGFDFLIRAVAAVPEEERPALRVVSNHVEPHYLAGSRQLAADLGVHLDVLSKISDARLADLYRRATLTVYAPVNEPFGLVPLESMACGTPVVAVGEGGVLETVEEGVTGRLVPRDPGAFARAVVDFLRDPETTERYGTRARAAVLARWQWDDRIQCLEKALHETALGRRNGSSVAA
jgi:glycosyltransferase involved in cell wall biosynthesis